MKIKTRLIYLPIATVISILVIVSHQIVVNSLPSSVIRSQTADKITVAIRGGGEASGVIVKRVGDTYTILTCAHAVRDLNGNGIVITPDRQEYQFTTKSVKMISGVDLAEISFKSNRSYKLAIVSKSRVGRGDTIYVSGWPDSKRERVFAAGKIVSTENRGKDGYDLTYTNTGIRGVSGGPVLNQDAELVGIHGKAENAEADGFPLYSGIPIGRYNLTQISERSIVSDPKVGQEPEQLSRTSQIVAISNSPFKLKYDLDTGNSGEFVPGITISPDSQYLIIGGDGGAITIWRISDGKLMRTIHTGTTAQVESVAISLDGQTIISGSDNIVRVWRLSDGHLLNALEGHSDYVRSVAISSDSQTIVSGSKDGTTKVWRFSDGTLLHTLKQHDTQVSWIHSVISLDGKNIVSQGNRNIKIWRLSDGKLLKTLERKDIYYHNVIISSDGSMIAASGEYMKQIDSKSILDLYRLSDGKLMKTLIDRPNSAFDVALISPNNHNLIVGQRDIQVRSLPDGKILQVLNHSPKRMIEVLAISPDGQILVSGNRGKTVKIWQRKVI